MGFWEVEYVAHCVYHIRVEADSVKEAEERAMDLLKDCEDYNVFGEIFEDEG